MYTEKDLYDEMTLYWAKGINDDEVYTWYMKRDALRSRGSSRDLTGYPAQRIVDYLNTNHCRLSPNLLPLIFN